jgi:hypothetical protein
VTDKEINAAIAEACGWTKIQNCEFRYHKSLGYPPLKAGQGENAFKILPDYSSDLNAIHKAIIVLPEESRHNYLGYLFEVVNVKKVGEIFNAHNATARQRAEAFLRTLGKWEEAQK